MGALKYAILGLLYQKNMTGYELTKEFETTLLQSWRAKHSQVYPELKSLTEKGLVQYEVKIAGNVLEKKEYSITEEGKNEFLQWAVKLNPIKPIPKDEFRLQLFFSSCIKPEERLLLLENQFTNHHNRLLELRKAIKKFSSIPPDDETEFGNYLVLLGAIMNEENTCKWLKKCITMCHEKMGIEVAAEN